MRKKLLVLDVEGTLFESRIRLPGTELSSTIWQAIAAALGPAAEQDEIDTHRKWHAGEYSCYMEWMKDTIRIHKAHGLRRKAFAEIVSNACYNAGVQETLSKVDRQLYEPVLISGGFSELATRVNRDFGFNHSFAACTYFFDAEERLSGFNLLPCDFEGKLHFIRLMLQEYRLGDSDWVFVGDGLNDVKIASAAPLSVGYRPHPALAQVVTYSITNFSDLLGILAESSRVAALHDSA